MRLPRLTADLSPLRESRDLRLVVLGNFVSGMGTQATLVALPYQLYIETHSAFLVGLLGAVELVPLITMALLGGVIADRMDRRRLLLLDQIGLVAASGGLAAVASRPAPWPGSPDRGSQSSRAGSRACWAPGSWSRRFPPSPVTTWRNGPRRWPPTQPEAAGRMCPDYAA
jgi:MFS family permease